LNKLNGVTVDNFFLFMCLWKLLILLRIIMSKRSPIVRKKKYNIITRVLYAENILHKSLLFKLWLKLVEQSCIMMNEPGTFLAIIMYYYLEFSPTCGYKKINNRELISGKMNKRIQNHVHITTTEDPWYLIFTIKTYWISFSQFPYFDPLSVPLL